VTGNYKISVIHVSDLKQIYAQQHFNWIL
jgi:hypothetical protein